MLSEPSFCLLNPPVDSTFLIALTIQLVGTVDTCLVDYELKFYRLEFELDQSINFKHKRGARRLFPFESDGSSIELT